MYTTSTWPHCVTAKEFLREKGVTYIEKNVNEDNEARKEMISLGIRGVPAFNIDGEIIVGFDKERILSKIDFNITSCHNCNKRMKYPKGKGTLLLTCPNCGTKYKVKS